MNFLIKYNLDELFRFLFSILCIILSLRLLVVPEAIENWNSYGVEANIRNIIGAGGLLASALFFWDKTIYVGGVLLLLGFAYATYLHAIGNHQISWLLFCIGCVISLLLLTMKRRSIQVEEKKEQK